VHRDDIHDSRKQENLNLVPLRTLFYEEEPDWTLEAQADRREPDIKCQLLGALKGQGKLYRFQEINMDEGIFGISFILEV